MKRIAVIPQVHGVGGMVSFRDKFVAALETHHLDVTFSLQPFDRLRAGSAICDAALVIGGTRDLFGLYRAKRHGMRIVQRLNGMNWLHRNLNTGVRHYLRAEYGNWNLNFVRTRLADHIVYQSEFSRDWWQRIYGPASVPSSVVYNGVDITAYAPDSTTGLQPSTPSYQLLLVEGSLMGGYELGLQSAVALAEWLNTEYKHELGKPVELLIAGRVSEAIKAHWQQHTQIPLRWLGLVPPERIPEIDRAADLLYASDINAACPNSVIEALACGTPVLAFDTGALAELVTGDSGRVVPYGGNPWNLDTPDVPALAAAAVEILQNQEKHRLAARTRAVQVFDLDIMVGGYLEALRG